jgi:RimJ/RimL family protein N-acetyltransferase
LTSNSVRVAYHETMEIRLSESSDIPVILAIYCSARAFMAAHGNPHQWTKGAPDEVSLKKDLSLKRSYVVVDQGVVVGTFALLSHDPNYDQIEGKWLNDDPYVALHRLASIKPGAGTFILKTISDHYPNVRIDTHHDNIPMRNLLTKMGFVHCGVIRLLDKDDSPREAYLKVSSL